MSHETNVSSDSALANQAAQTKNDKDVFVAPQTPAVSPPR